MQRRNSAPRLRRCWPATVPAWLLAVTLVACLGASLVTVAVAEAGTPPVNTKPPTVSGTYKEGRVLTAKEGTWSGTVESFTFVWQRCTAENVCADIETPGHGLATGTEYTLTAEDVRMTLRVLVTAHNSAGNGEAYSAQTNEIAGIPPKKEEPPVISGKAEDGQLLSVSNGTWGGTPATKYSYLWESCLKKECKAAVGPDTEATYRVVTSQEEAKETLRAVVTDESRAGNASATSTATAVVAAGPPVSIAPPTVSGEAREGQELKASAGTWLGTPTISYTYRWLSCTSLENCVAVATGTSYTPGALELGDTLEVEVTAKNAVEPVTAISAKTATVVGNPPVNTKPPAISGEAREGQTLTASAGTWTGTEPITYEYEWKSCNPKAECSERTGATYLLAGTDVGNTLQVRVTAKNAIGSANASSAPTATVVGNPPVNTEPPTISGEAREGQTLTASAGTWTGTGPITYEYEWKSCNAKSECAETSGATYLLTRADVGNKLEVVVTAKNSAGSAHATSAATAVVAANGGAVVAWGINKSYELGAGYHNADEEAPVAVREPGHADEANPPEMSHVVEVASAYWFSIALLSNGQVRAWGGDDVFSELGGETKVGIPQSRPVTVLGPSGGPLEGVKAISARGAHSEALMSNGSVMVWGSDAEGQLGQGELNPERVRYVGGEPVRERTMFGTASNHAEEVKNLEGEAVAVAAGKSSSYALMKNGTVMAWGENHEGELGIGVGGAKGEHKNEPEGCISHGETSCSTKPRHVCAVGHSGGLCENESEYLKGVKAIAAGENAAYALLNNGEVLAWGTGASGQLGNPSLDNSASDVPVKVSLGAYEHHVVALAGGDAFALALLEDGEVIGWGKNESGQLGPKSGELCKKAECVATPRLIPELEKIKAIAGGEKDMALALSESGDLLSWGANFPDAQLGLGHGSTLEVCGTVKVEKLEGTEQEQKKEQKQKEREDRELACSRGPRLVRKNVSAISAGQSINTAILQPGFSGPARPVNLIALDDALKLEWTRPGAAYFVSYRGVSEQVQEDEAKEEELREAEEAFLQLAHEAGEQDETTQEAKYLEEAKKAAAELAEVKRAIKKAEEENPWAKQVKITGTEKCSTETCAHVIEGLTAGEPYEVRLKKEETEEEEGGTLFIPGIPE